MMGSTHHQQAKINYFKNSEGKKILWIEPFMLDGPLRKRDTIDILKGLVERGHEVDMIAMRSRKVIILDRNLPIHVISIPLRSVPLVSSVMFAVALFFLLPLHIINYKPNFIIARPHISTISVIPATIFASKVKFVLDVRSTPVETSGFRGFLQNLWFVPSVFTAKKLFDGITIISHPMKREVCERFNINQSKVGVWTSGVSIALFNPKNSFSKNIELRKKLGLSKKFVVFYHGVFTTTRGLTETIKALEMLKSAIPNIAFFLLGTGPLSPLLKELIQREKLQDIIIIHNPVDQKEVPKYVGMSDVCIIPLPNHPFWRFQCPLKLLEYLAMEKVVIATDMPAHRSIMSEEKCAIYISSVEPTEIAKAIEYAYFNKDNLEKWGKIGREIIKEKYTWEKVASDLENYLLSINH